MGKASEIWKEIKPKIGEMLMAVNNIETQAEKAQEEAYQRGLSDAWEMAKKIQDTGGNLTWWIHNTSAPEAIEKIRQYEQEKEEIKVGDEVSLKGGSRGFVTRIVMSGGEQKSAYVVWSDGYVGNYSFDALQKTGKHYSDVVEVLQRMKEAENG